MTIDGEEFTPTHTNANLDGKLSFEEFLGEENHIEKIFKTMDKDNDGYISKQVRKWLINIYIYSGTLKYICIILMSYIYDIACLFCYDRFPTTYNSTSVFDSNQCSGSHKDRDY